MREYMIQLRNAHTDGLPCQQPLHTPPNVRRFPLPGDLSPTCDSIPLWLTFVYSRENTITTQSTSSRGKEAAVAAVWKPMVRWLHHAHHRQLCQSWHSYVITCRDCLEVPLTVVPGFVAFDQYKKLLADEDGKLSGPKTVLAGFGAGVTESLLAVTPTESIKTTL